MFSVLLSHCLFLFFIVKSAVCLHNNLPHIRLQDLYMMQSCDLNNVLVGPEPEAPEASADSSLAVSETLFSGLVVIVATNGRNCKIVPHDKMVGKTRGKFM